MSPSSRQQTPRVPWMRRLGLDMRPGEGELCLSLFAIHFLALTFQYTAKSVRQSTYIDALGAEQLPYVYLLVALLSFPLLRLYGRLVSRFSERRLLIGTSLTVAASMVLFRGLFRLQQRWVSVAFYLWIAIVGLLLVSQFWWFASHRLDPRQAKRLFALIGAGGLLGGIAGGQIARWASHHGSLDALWAAAVVLALQALLIAWVSRRRASLRPVAETSAPEIEDLGAAKGGFARLRQSRYLQLVALLMLLSAMVAQVIDLQFSWVIEQSTSTLAERTAAFGNLFSIMGLSALVFQLLFTSRILKRLGVGFALRVLPLSNGLGSALFLFAVLMAPGLLIPVVWALKISENGLRYSLDQATRELLFLPVPTQQRGQVKAFIDVFVQRLAKGLIAVALLTVTLGWVDVEQTVWLSLGLVVLWLSLIGATHRQYVASFRRGLVRRQGSGVDLLPIDDVATLEHLIEGLGSQEPREVLHSLDLLEQHGRGRLVSPFLLHHDDAEVRVRTLEILQVCRRDCAASQIERLLLDDHAGVRVAATRALAALSSGDVRQVMSERLMDPDARIRGAAIGYLLAQEECPGRTQADTTLLEMLADGEPKVRVAAAKCLGNLPDPIHQASLIRLLFDGDPNVVLEAIEAVRSRAQAGDSGPLYPPILISLLRHRQLKHEARGALVAHGEAVVPALEHFMDDPHENIWVRRALPKTMARIGGQAALDALVRSLDEADLFLRRKIIEALGSLLQHEGLRPDPAVVEQQIQQECRDHLHARFAIVSLARGGNVGDLSDPSPRRPSGSGPVPRAASASSNGGPHLVERLLADRMRDHLRNVFNLLALMYSPRDIRATHESLASDRPGLRAHALEYLDNLLQGELRQQVFAVIDDLPGLERQRLAQRLFGVQPRSATAALEGLVTQRTPGDEDAVWLSAAALHYIHDQQIESLYWVIQRAAASDKAPLIQETTESLLAAFAAAEPLSSPPSPS